MTSAQSPTPVFFNALGRRYGAHWALKDASGELRVGEIVALRGENGSGKSTLLLVLAGILQPHRGNFTLAGGAHLVAHQTMAYPHLSIRRNLELAAIVDKREKSTIASALEFWKIEPLAQKNVGTLSRGQLQRFLMARATIARREILLLDEPFTGLDSAGEDLLAAFIEAEARRGASVLFSEHSASRAAALAQRIVRMADGRCVS